MTTRSVAIVAGIVVAAVVIVAAYLLGTHTHQAHPAATAAEAPVSAPAAAPRSTPALDDPVAAATGWLRAYRGLQWTDPSPSSWVDRVRPYVGEDLADEYDRARQGSVGPSWTTFVADKCTATVRDADGVIPSEAPRAPDSVYVQVAGTVVTECAAGAPPMPTEPIAATVEVRRMPDGRWIVNRRLF